MTVQLPTASDLYNWLLLQDQGASLGIARSMGDGPLRAYMAVMYPGGNFETGCTFDPDDADDIWYLHYAYEEETGTLNLPYELASWEVAYNKCRPLDGVGGFDDSDITVHELLQQVDGAVAVFE